jgi:LysR family hydrogen peroxide-inducible transcriptional activator
MGTAMVIIDQLDIRDLQCVVVLAETLNFTETAKRLHMTQPGVTARINKVEKNEECKLFDRSKGVVRAITPEGFVFVEEAKRILEDFQRLITRTDAAHRAFSERLAVSRPRHVDLQLLSIVVAAQAVEGMHISFQQPCDSDEEAIAMLLNGKADVALVAWPVTEPYVAPLHLTHDTLLAVLPENHVLRGRTEIHLADLCHEQIIGSKHQFPKALKDALLGRCRTLGSAPEWLCISASPAESVHLVDTGAGTGITLVTKRYSEELTLTKAVYIPFPDDEIAYEYGVAYRQSDHRSVLNDFLQYLVEKCRPVEGPRGRRKPKAQATSKPNRKTG